MKDVAPQDRPREKLECLRAHGLGDNELVALVLGSGLRDTGALVLANRLIASAGGLHGLARVGVDGLRHLAGVGPAKAAQSSRLLSWVGERLYEAWLTVRGSRPRVISRRFSSPSTAPAPSSCLASSCSTPSTESFEFASCRWIA